MTYIRNMGERERKETWIDSIGEDMPKMDLRIHPHSCVADMPCHVIFSTYYSLLFATRTRERVWWRGGWWWWCYPDNAARGTVRVTGERARRKERKVEAWCVSVGGRS